MLLPMHQPVVLVTLLQGDTGEGRRTTLAELCRPAVGVDAAAAAAAEESYDSKH